MIVEVFESSTTESTTEIRIDNVDVYRVIPFRDYVGRQIAIGELKVLLDEVLPFEDVNMDEPEYYYAQKVPVWLDGNIVHEKAAMIDMPHHIGLRFVLESVLQKYNTSDNIHIRIS